MNDEHKMAVHFTEREAQLVFGICRIKKRQLEKILVRSDFVPPPGKRDANAVQIEKLAGAMGALREAFRRAKRS